MAVGTGHRGNEDLGLGQLCRDSEMLEKETVEGFQLLVMTRSRLPMQ